VDLDPRSPVRVLTLTLHPRSVLRQRVEVSV
jgi:hypothetical protein